MKAVVRKTARVQHRQALRSNERRLVTQHLRRRILSLAAGAAALPAVSRVAWAQTYPTRPVRLIVGFPAGSGLDIVARLLGQWLSDRLGQPFVIDNRPGAGGSIAAETLLKAPPDGYTLLQFSLADAFGATLYEKLGPDRIRNISPIATIMRVPFMLVVNPSVPTNTVGEFISYAKANPGKVVMASSGVGSGPHIFGELFKATAGVDLLHVPYRGNHRPDLLSGQAQVMFDGINTALEFVRTGMLRALAVTTTARLSALPSVPTISEFVQGYEASGWQGIVAPKNTPGEIVDKLNTEVTAALGDSRIKARLSDLGGTPMSMTPGEFGKFIADETEKWAKVIRAANIKAE